MGKLDRRIALIIGGDHGIGLLTAKEFVKEGAYVFIRDSIHSQLAAAVFANWHCCWAMAMRRAGSRIPSV
jgi:NAD(P)-dependent dehydrogenase (short-subunit alcohol dehydrogenase family)